MCIDLINNNISGEQKRYFIKINYIIVELFIYNVKCLLKLQFFEIKYIPIYRYTYYNPTFYDKKNNNSIVASYVLP